MGIPPRHSVLTVRKTAMAPPAEKRRPIYSRRRRTLTCVRPYPPPD
ncbi:hypothetical protein BN903_204 [Halorubrum sp. AJ67]|nr:hypothetical protein BN903_204 [Halorubrum sp. AJ67]